MTVRRIVANIASERVREVEAFYRDLFGLEPLMDLGWIVTLGSGESAVVQMSILSEGGSGAPVPDLSIEVEDVDAVHGRAQAMGCEIAYALTDEPWGRMLPSLVGAAEHDDDLRRGLLAFNAERRGESQELLQRAVERGEISGDHDLHGALERFIAPFFFRRVVTHEPLDDDFVEAQLAAVCAALGAPYTPGDATKAP